METITFPVKIKNLEKFILDLNSRKPKVGSIIILDSEGKPCNIIINVIE